MAIKEMIVYDLAEIIKTGIGGLDVTRKYESLDKEMQKAVRLCHSKNYIVLSDQFFGTAIDELAKEIYDELFFKEGEGDLLKKIYQKFARKDTETVRKREKAQRQIEEGSKMLEEGYKVLREVMKFSKGPFVIPDY